MISDLKLRMCLADSWGLAEATIEVHNGGMNSATWFVGEGGRRWVAKAVAPASSRFGLKSPGPTARLSPLQYDPINFLGRYSYARPPTPGLRQLRDPHSDNGTDIGEDG